MYHPYFRGKQFELITIRETCSLLASAGFAPIIEPVKEALSGLDRTLKAVCDAGGNAVVIVNPYHGDHRENGIGISSLLEKGFLGNDHIAAGVPFQRPRPQNFVLILARLRASQNSR